MLRINNIVKEYSRNVRANDQITFTVKKGEIFGLLGPNGSGKTTLVSQVVGFLKPTNGEITLDGKDIVVNPKLARKLCSLQPQNQVSLNGLTPRQAIELTGKIRGGNAKVVRERTEELLSKLQLENWADKQVDHLSGGIKRLVSFCMATVFPGKLVILDEPTNDVDPIRRKLLWQQIRKLASEGIAILLVTHNVLEAEKAVDRLALINQGKLIRLGTPTDLKGDFDKRLRLEIMMQHEENNINFPDHFSIVNRTKQRVILSVEKDQVNEIINWSMDLQVTGKIEEFSLSAATLEDAYFYLIENGGSNNGTIR